MSDLALKWQEVGGGGDLVVSQGDLMTADDLRANVITSLFCDARAEESDQIPDNTEDPRGWWGDAYADVQGDVTGSRLWLLARSVQSLANLQRASEYARAALQWMLDDGVASAIDVTAEAPQRGTLVLHVSISEPQGNRRNFKFWLNWQAQRELSI